MSEKLFKRYCVGLALLWLVSFLFAGVGHPDNAEAQSSKISPYRVIDIHYPHTLYLYQLPDGRKCVVMTGGATGGGLSCD